MAALIFGEPAADDARLQLDGRGLCAPTLLPYELANIARRKADRDPPETDLILSHLEDGLAMDIELVPVPYVAVCRLALATGLTGYDASYLFLARLRSVPLLTFDQRLARAAR